MNSFSNYVELRQTQIKRRQRLIAFVSTGLFLGSTVFAVGNFFTDAFRQSAQPKTNSNVVRSQSALEEKGYELVLQREPDNQVALEGLVDTRLKMHDLQGAQESLEKLIKLNPSSSRYQALLVQVKKNASDH
jgi:hypothetical protein